MIETLEPRQLLAGVFYTLSAPETVTAGEPFQIQIEVREIYRHQHGVKSTNVSLESTDQAARSAEARSAAIVELGRIRVFQSLPFLQRCEHVGDISGTSLLSVKGVPVGDGTSEAWATVEALARDPGRVELRLGPGPSQTVINQGAGAVPEEMIEYGSIVVEVMPKDYCDMSGRVVVDGEEQ